MENDFELFPGKKLSGVFKDIYNNQQFKKRKLNDLIDELKNMILGKDIRDITMLVPLIRELLDTSVKNDDSLIKMAAIAQRIMITKNKLESTGGILTDDEKKQLLEELESVNKEVNETVDPTIAAIEDDVKKLKDRLNNDK